MRCAATSRPRRRPDWVAADVDGRRVGSLQDAYLGTPDGPVTPVLPGHLIGDLQAHAPMMVVHLAAAALVGLWLAHGERLLDLGRDADRPPPAGRWSAASSRSPYRPVSLASYDALHAPAGPRSVWLTRPDSRRGPPLLLALAPARPTSASAGFPCFSEERHDRRPRASARPRSTRQPTKATTGGGWFRAFWRWHFFASFLVVPILLMLAVTGLIYLFRFQLEPLLHADLMKVDPVGGTGSLPALRDPGDPGRPGLPRRRDRLDGRAARGGPQHGLLDRDRRRRGEGRVRRPVRARGARLA